MKDIYLRKGERKMSEEATKAPAEKWACPECGQKVTLFVKPSAPPTCGNPKVHPNKIVKMEAKVSRR